MQRFRPRVFAFPLICVAASLGAAAGAQPVAVTNLAGRAARGELVAVTGRAVKLRGACGAEQTIPLRALAASERVRLRRLAGVPEPKSPAEEKIERALANALARIDARAAAGQLSAEEAAQRRAEARKWTDLKQRSLKQQKRRIP